MSEIDKALRIGLAAGVALVATACIEGKPVLKTSPGTPKVSLDDLKNPDPPDGPESVSSMESYINKTFGFSFMVPAGYEYDRNPDLSDSDFRFVRLVGFGSTKGAVLTGIVHTNKDNMPIPKSNPVQTSISGHKALLYVATQSPKDVCGNPDTTILRDIRVALVEGNGYILELNHISTCPTYRSDVDMFRNILETLTFSNDKKTSRITKQKGQDYLQARLERLEQSDAAHRLNIVRARLAELRRTTA